MEDVIAIKEDQRANSHNNQYASFNLIIKYLTSYVKLSIRWRGVDAGSRSSRTLFQTADELSKVDKAL